MNWLNEIFSKIEAFFASAKGKQTVATINTLVQTAIPIVGEISSITGNAGSAATAQAVEAAYVKFAIPLTQVLTTGNSTQIGNALLNLATTVLQKNLPANQAGVATNILNTAVSLAVTATKVGL
jgi:hypothetical protein